MEICSTISGMQESLSKARKAGKTIGFVPTMGALHEGHLELMRRAKQENDVLVVSIFVNPIQFNNPDDLAKYPRTIETDKEMLESVQCDFLFFPAANEIYPETPTEKYDFGLLEQSMEGEKRPGHFNGVAIVVKKLFDIVQPDKAYFGEKDYQQLAIIREMTRMHKLAVDIVPCPTVRESDGLALSSRNMRLSAEARKHASLIHKAMIEAATHYPGLSPAEMKKRATEKISENQLFTIEYIEVADDRQLQPLVVWENAVGARMFAAVFLEGVRLIDNIRIF